MIYPSLPSSLPPTSSAQSAFPTISAMQVVALDCEMVLVRRHPKPGVALARYVGYSRFERSRAHVPKSIAYRSWPKTDRCSMTRSCIYLVILSSIIKHERAASVKVIWKTVCESSPSLRCHKDLFPFRG